MHAKRLLLCLIFIALIAALMLWWRGRLDRATAPTGQAPSPSLEASEHTVVESGKLTFFRRPTAEDWATLRDMTPWQTAREVEQTLRDVYALNDGWQQWIQLEGDQLRVKISDRAVTLPAVEGSAVESATPEKWLELSLATETATQQASSLPRRPPVRWWRKACELPPAPMDRVLEGLNIAIDPGHIGGAWAAMEERRFVVGTGKPVAEGDMTLMVARILQPQLEALGARVQLVRQQAEPTTTWRPQALLDDLRRHPVPQLATVEAVDAEKLFYRTAEIHARAERVNRQLQPDVVLCLHFDAVSWGNPERPSLVDSNHLHLIVNGAFTEDEWAEADQRLALMKKLLNGVSAEEIALSQSVAKSMVEATCLPPYTYDPKSNRARNIADNPYIWARNLLANRLYECPVVYLEPYVMNSHDVYQRVQRGDYLGTEMVAGKMRRSIYREYADGVTAGLVQYYRAARSQN